MIGSVLVGMPPRDAHAQDPKTSIQSMADGVSAWVSQQRGLDVSQVKMDPIDPRVTLQNCKKEFTYSFPISSFESVKVSCPSPKWHLFVRVKFAPPVQTAAVLPQASETSPSAPASDSKSDIRQVWVSAHFLSTGTPVSAQQLSLESRGSGQIGLQALDPKTDFTYMEVTHDVPAGTILRKYDIRPQILVKRGQMIQMNIGQGRDFQISARVEAMQDGRYGEQIKVKNAESGRILSGIVKGPGLISGS